MGQEQLLLKYKEKFWDAFHRPNLKTQKYLKIWEDLETNNYWLAGPLFNVYEQGNFSYLLEDQEKFSTINSIQDFVIWANELVKQYRESVFSNFAENIFEEEDEKILRYQIDIKLELIQLASQIQEYQSQKT